MADRLRAVCITGPTASGKTTLAVELARRFPFDVISVDSAMVYRHMDIGTAKPAAGLLREIPHALIDIREPWETYSAGDFCADAESIMRTSAAAGRIPLLVGGTLLYFRALTEGLAPLPQADNAVRRALDERAAVAGWPALHAELALIDPAAATRIDPGDAQRIQRALEVHELTGVPISELQKSGSRSPVAEYFKIDLLPGDRTVLYQRIEERFTAMMAAGFLDEVRALKARPEMRDRPASMRAVGYRQLWAHLQGETSLAEAEDRARTATRRYAKRQLTWMRAQSADVSFDSLDSGHIDAVCRAVETLQWFGAN